MTNLLPQTEKKVLKKNYILRVLAVIIFLVFLIFVISNLLMLPALAVLHFENESAVSSIAETGNRIKGLEAEHLEETVKDTNRMVGLLQEERKSESMVTEIIRVIVSHVNPKVKITSISYGPAINISGTAKDRDGYQAFLWALQKETDYFPEVDAPIANLIKDKDLSFVINLSGIK
jgi:hypothetical protein